MPCIRPWRPVKPRATAACPRPCLVCGVPFTFNPQRVPSYDAGRGKRPICRSCMERINEKRRASGEDPHPIPEAAYEIPQGEP